MKKLLALLALAVLAAPAAFAQSGNTNNNGARVGKAGFLLNVKAFAQCPEGKFSGHQIAVQADFTGAATDNTAKVNKIFLSSGPGFQVEDGNACDDTGAYFYLPIDATNCRNCSGSPLATPTFREYEVRARVVGKPGGRATITSCVEVLEIDPVTGAEVATSLCSVGPNNIRVATRNTGGGRAQNEWQNVSAQLLTVCVDTSGDGVCDDRIGLFDSLGEGYWWNFDTAGRPHLQLVFLPAAPQSSEPPGGSLN